MKKEMKNPISDEKKNAWNRNSNRRDRGGSWDFLAGFAHVSSRGAMSPLDRSDDIGFRVVRNKK